ncbi:MAG: hypothetical protein IPM54_05135 [Polyangiaceae bacterium]|nr:hypothetical protein [Polyangiaceae bacterium]
MLRTPLLARFVLPAITATMFFASAAFARPADDAKEGDSTADETSSEKGKDAAEPENSIWNTTEDPTKAYRYIGARYRHVIVPQFVLNLFAAGGALSHVPIAGLEFGTRRDHIELVFSLSYADYATGDLMFKGKDEPDIGYEKVNSDLGVIFGKAEILYEIPLDKKSRFALLIGGGVGIGGVIGDLYRSQAYPLEPGADPADPSQWGRCSSSGVPDVAYCSNDNEHFGNYAEPSWIGGGAKPIVFPWIALPQVSFRYKPLRFLQARVDAGLALSSGFYFGGSIDYIL